MRMSEWSSDVCSSDLFLPKAPEKYGRTRFESEALARRNFVLGSMEDNCWIPAAQRDAARAMPLGLTDSGNRAVAQVGGYYMAEGRSQLITEFGATAEDCPHSVCGGGRRGATPYDGPRREAQDTGPSKGPH